ncbi:thioredoxin domain-containing protein [Salegentibacter sediminis]|uniref:thioredoxin domain-containing protein n=1 Tax=Salegentibacter sediminis TaxID=1930251 RepID=UPI0009BE269F|nr:thioredoxin domain-containing protein [Salegentibacter sediminis]
MENEKPQFTNDLIHETSPYLLQHAHNPVDWKAWNDQSLEKAARENKLLIISVGYSACHWCHVMEHESFEDPEVAKVMNADFVNIKVDREERPDIDQVYMNAVQVMTGTGGWPMNIVALPDGRPVWGGTYFRREQWINALKQLSVLYEQKPEQLQEYAGKLEEGLQKLQLIELPGEEQPFSRDIYPEILQQWKAEFDLENGGYKGAPKFMMPNNYKFLLRFGFQQQDEEIQNFTEKTLTKMAWGGVYDPVGGGFSRYSVDNRWHVPHFEKMLYDNAQLVSLYSKAYKIDQNNLYKSVIEKTLEFIQEELTAPDYAFYSALDADSLNEKGKSEEGAFYTWTKSELENLLQDDFKLFSAYFNINNYGKWEKDRYVLIRTKASAQIASEYNISEEKLQEKVKSWMRILKKHRENRKKPALDDKTLTSWNALMLSGYLDAYTALQDPQYLDKALKNANFIKTKQIASDGRLFHTYKNGKSSINAYLEDYAFTIEAFIKLHEITFEASWLMLARDLCEICIEDFTEDSPMFYFTSNKDRKLITRTLEIMDNVIPASNSVMAKNLFKLAALMEKPEYKKRAEKMLKSVYPQIKNHPGSYSNWLDLLLNFTHPFYEIAIAGENAKDININLQKRYLPNTLITGSTAKSSLPLLQHRFQDNQDRIYVCSEGKCDLPQTSVEKAINLIKHF